MAYSYAQAELVDWGLELIERDLVIKDDYGIDDKRNCNWGFLLNLFARRDNWAIL